jgi:hypothetical protein
MLAGRAHPVPGSYLILPGVIEMNGGARRGTIVTTGSG